MKDKNKPNQHHNHKNDNVEHSNHNKANSPKNKSKNESSQHKDHDSHDHTDHHRMMIKDFKLRFWISLIFTLPILRSRQWFKIYLVSNFHFSEKQINTFFLDFPLLFSFMAVGLFSKVLLMS